MQYVQSHPICAQSVGARKLFFLVFDLKKLLATAISSSAGTLYNQLKNMTRSAPGRYGDISDGRLYQSIRLNQKAKWSDATKTLNTDGSPVLRRVSRASGPYNSLLMSFHLTSGFAMSLWEDCGLPRCTHLCTCSWTHLWSSWMMLEPFRGAMVTKPSTPMCPLCAVVWTLQQGLHYWIWCTSMDITAALGACWKELPMVVSILS